MYAVFDVVNTKSGISISVGSLVTAAAVAGVTTATHVSRSGWLFSFMWKLVELLCSYWYCYYLNSAPRTHCLALTLAIFCICFKFIRLIHVVHFMRFYWITSVDFSFTFILRVLFDSDCLVFDDHCMRCTAELNEERQWCNVADLSRSYKLYVDGNIVSWATSKIRRQTTTDQITSIYTHTHAHTGTHLPSSIK